MSRLVIVDEVELESIIDRIVRRAIRHTEDSPANEIPEYLDIAQAAKFVRMSTSALYTYTSKRWIPFIKRGRRLHFKKSDLIVWLDGGRKKTREEIAAEIMPNRKGGQS